MHQYLILAVLALVLVPIISETLPSLSIPTADAYQARYGHINWVKDGTRQSGSTWYYTAQYRGHAAVQTETAAERTECVVGAILNIGSITPGEGGNINAVGIKVTRVIPVPGDVNSNKICYGDITNNSNGNYVTKEYTQVLSGKSGGDWQPGINRSPAANSPSGGQKVIFSANYSANLAGGLTEIGSSVTNVPPIVYCPLVNNCQFTIPVSDPDSGDYFKFRKGTNSDGGNSGTDTFYTLDANTGKISLDASGFVNNSIRDVYIVIDTYRTGFGKIGTVATEFLIQAKAIVGNGPSFSSPQDGTAYTVVANGVNTISFNVVCTDLDGGNTLTMYPLGEPSGSIFTTSSSGNNLTGSFSWTPTSASTNPIVFTCTDPVENQAIQTTVYANALSTATVPNAPIITSVGDATTSSLRVSWSPPSNDGGDAITDYKLRRSTDGVTWTVIDNSDITSSSTSYVLTGLAASTTYQIQIAAQNSKGWSVWSSSTPGATITTPGPPLNPIATRGNSQVSFSWTTPVSNGGSPITDYILRYTTNNSTWSVFNRDPSTATSGTITGLTNGQAYTFKIAAVNAAGRGTNSTTVNSNVGLPPNPSNLIITPGNSLAKLKFNVASGEAPLTGAKIENYNSITSSYDVLYAYGSSSVSISDNDGDTREITITGLINEQKYSLRVTPYNSFGAGTVTNNVVVIPTANTSDLISSGVLEYYQPPTTTNSLLTNLTAKGYTGGVIASPGIVPLSSMKPFDAAINQNMTLTTAIDKTTTLTTVLRNYGIPTYAAPSAWNSTNVFIVPPTIIPIKETGSTVGQQGVYSIQSVSPQKPAFMSLSRADPIPIVKGKIVGVSFKLNATATANQFNMSSSYTSTPPNGVTSIRGALMYLDFKTSTTSPVNFGKSTTYDSNPSISFRLGPLANSTSNTSPTNTVNPAITCPEPNVFFVADDGTTSTTGIAVNRDTSGDDNTSCGYSATIPHFSVYVVKASTSSGSQSQSGSSSNSGTIVPGPQLVDEPDDYVLRIMNSKYKKSEIGHVVPTYIPVGVPVEIEINLSDAAGADNISHVELYLNKQDSKILNDLSETTVIYDKSYPNALYDKNGIVDSYTIIPTVKNSKAYYTYQITFKKQIPLSDIVFRAWNSQRQFLDVYVNDALAVTSSTDPITVCHVSTGKSAPPETITITKSELDSHLSHGDLMGKCVVKTGAIKDWVKQYVELYEFGLIADEKFKEGMGYLVDQKVIVMPDTQGDTSVTTDQFKKQSMNWYEDQINNDDYLGVIKDYFKKLFG